MKQVLLREGRAVVEEVAEPVAEAGRVLVRTAFSLVSAGTERAVLEATGRQTLLGAAADPGVVRKALGVLRNEGPKGILDRLQARAVPSEAVPGYAASGVVLEVGRGVSDLPPGTRVACGGSGYACHAERIAVPRPLCAPVPPGVSLEEAAFTTLGAIALQGVRRSGIVLGESAVVLGLGLVGTLTAQILRAAGAVVIGFDADRERAARLRALGIEAYDLAARDPRDEVPRATGGLLADAVLVCAASKGSEVSNLALRLARRKGRVVLVGDVGLDLDRALIYEKELDILMSTSYGPGRYDPSYEERGIDYPPAYVRWTENRNFGAFLRLVQEKRVRLRPLIDLTVGLEEARAVYERIAAPSGPRPLGVLLRYGADEGIGPGDGAEAPGTTQRRVPTTTGVPAADDVEPVPAGAVIGVVVCGAGAFVRASHLPAMRGLPDVRAAAIVSGTPAGARDAARRFDVPKAGTDLGAQLDDPSHRLVLIGTRHDLHEAQVRTSLRAGRHVLVEKPLCLHEDEIAPLLDEARARRRLLAVGFNRRYSPLALRMREALGHLAGPAFAVYRVNAGALPASHWVFDPVQGGGRVIGECCHFVDLLLYLMQAPVVSIEARALLSDGINVVQGDSFTATLGFGNGSSAVLVYTGLGNAGLPKERLEIFKGGASLLLDDFRALEVYGGPGGTVRLPRQDKGIEAQWRAVVARLRGEPSEVIRLDEIEATMRTTFRLDRAVRGERCAS
ncbi:MAG TPA: bi-domain-containing oxidoreductase [Candidatus Polarisedimenticolia bacterium]|jgi:predicted dehydrogenase/threonine dehydrogenase-like Zn-dependent dehydrogenase|nr:bi-domain-containing oxidoreductase [Candidatus Polarisedimenticolia bacterium]